MKNILLFLAVLMFFIDTDIIGQNIAITDDDIYQADPSAMLYQTANKRVITNFVGWFG